MARSDPRYGPLIIEQGISTRRFFTFTNKYTGAVIDPVALGYTAAVLQVRTAHLGDGGELLINLTTSNGGIVLGLQTDDNGVQRSGRIYISQAAAARLVEWGEGVYDMLMTHSSGQVDKAAYGPAVLAPVTSEV